MYAGLAISATTAFSHDIFYHIWKKEKTNEKEQLWAARLTAFVIGFLSTLFALRLESINVTFLVSMTFIVAASSIFPVLILTIYWKRFTHVGAISAIISGVAASIIFVALGPYIMNPVDGWINADPIFSLYNPGIITIPIGFAGALLGSLFSKNSLHKETNFHDFYIKAQTGISSRGDQEW